MFVREKKDEAPENGRDKLRTKPNGAEVSFNTTKSRTQQILTTSKTPHPKL
jgi:hypothetical protein